MGNSNILQHSPHMEAPLGSGWNRSEQQLFYLIVLARIQTRDLWLSYHIELYAPTRSTQKLKRLGRGWQFTYTSTILNPSQAILPPPGTNISNCSPNPSQVKIDIWCKCLFLDVLHTYKMRSMSETAYAQTRVWSLSAWTSYSCRHIHPSHSPHPRHSLQSHNPLCSHHRQHNLKPITSSTSFASISNCP